MAKATAQLLEAVSVRHGFLEIAASTSIRAESSHGSAWKPTRQLCARMPLVRPETRLVMRLLLSRTVDACPPRWHPHRGRLQGSPRLRQSSTLRSVQYVRWACQAFSQAQKSGFLLRRITSYRRLLAMHSSLRNSCVSKGASKACSALLPSLLLGHGTFDERHLKYSTSTSSWLICTRKPAQWRAV